MELKFRAWDKKMQMMVEDVIPFGINGDLLLKNGEAWSPFNPKRLEFMQYIGTRDENGKEIYRGDIVKTKDGKLFEVVYNKEYARYQLGNKRTIMPFDELEVVGNIYENKEVLK